ncbi:MAG: DEAD/DEAH box helicase [Rectinemataceae bacterium]
MDLSSFSSFSFDPRVTAGIDAAGYETPTPVQAQAIPAILEGRDLLGLAQTGTGKTAAFVLPILQRLLGGDRCRPRVLIVSPTRELAEQTHNSIEKLAAETGFRSMTMYGGVTTKSQVKILRTRLPEIIVACPGRLLDLMGQGFVDLKAIEMFVLDEADQMFDMGFLPSIRKIAAALPPKRQTMLFSATMPSEIRALAREFQRDPVRVEISITKPLETVSHFVYPVAQGDKYEMLRLLLPQTEGGQALIFTRTKHRAKKLALQLSNGGHNATSLQGNLSQGQREKAMESFRSGRVKVMVATDIAARGIDISLISHVINFDIPDTAEAYTHRIGRTGRMLRKGTALTFVTPEDGAMLKTIEKAIGSPIARRSIEGFTPSTHHEVEENSRPAQARRPAESRHSTEPRRSTEPRHSTELRRSAVASQRNASAADIDAVTGRIPSAGRAPVRYSGRPWARSSVSDGASNRDQSGYQSGQQSGRYQSGKPASQGKTPAGKPAQSGRTPAGKPAQPGRPQAGAGQQRSRLSRKSA